MEEDNAADPPTLSPETMKALLEFYEEQNEREAKLHSSAQGKIPESFSENWNMSQFWYSDETAEALALECLRQSPDAEIACISCPSLFSAIRRLNPSQPQKLFEYDTRFSVFQDDFVFFDYKSPLDIPRIFRERFALVIADPPYLSEECLTKTAIAIKFVAKPNAKLILCTGSVMGDLAGRLLRVKSCMFPIKHSRSLSNEFICYANYNLDDNCKLL